MAYDLGPMEDKRAGYDGVVTSDARESARRINWINEKSQQILKNAPGYEFGAEGFMPQVTEVAYLGDRPIAIRVAMLDEDDDVIVNVIIGHDDLMGPGSPFLPAETIIPVQQREQKLERAPQASPPIPLAARLPNTVKRPAVKSPGRYAEPKDRALYNTIMNADAALAGMFKSLGSQVRIVTGSTARLAIENPKVVLNLAAMAASASLAAAVVTGPTTAPAPFSPPAAETPVASIKTSPLVPLQPAPTEAFGMALSPGIKPMSPEAKRIVNDIDDPGLRAVAFNYTQQNYYQKLYLDGEGPKDEYMAHWPLRAAEAVDELWYDQSMRTKLRGLGFTNPSEVYRLVLAFAEIESRFGKEPTNEVNGAVLGLYHFEDRTFMTITRRMGVAATPSDRLNDTNLATKAMVNLLVDNITRAGKRAKRINTQDITGHFGYIYGLHVLGMGTFLNAVNLKASDHPADVAFQRRAMEDNRSLYYFGPLKRTREGMFNELRDRIERSDRKNEGRGFDFALAKAPEAVIARIPSNTRNQKTL